MCLYIGIDYVRIGVMVGKYEGSKMVGCEEIDLWLRSSGGRVLLWWWGGGVLCLGIVFMVL